jgi:hypothetical protein
LTPELKLRFVDKLAESMGAQLVASMQQQALVTAVPADGEGAMYKHTLQQQEIEGYMVLPSGARAPEIALPLASAALGAFVMSSLQSLGASPAVNAVAAKKAATVSV